MPAEWERHDACWLAWPSDQQLWGDDLQAARREFGELCRAIGGERLEILVPGAADEAEAARQLSGLEARYHHVAFGDIWLRDTGPVFVRNSDGGLETSRFAFNGWGRKYVLDGDDRVAARVAKLVGLPERVFPWVFEGGAVDIDGEGGCLAARDCLLDPLRNPAMSQPEMTAALGEALGVERVTWLVGTLAGDHTDGHVDTVARFVAPGRVLCMEARETDDPNRSVLAGIAAELARTTDAQGRKAEIVAVPSPGPVLENESDELMPASYLNFYISNDSVVVPVFGTPYDAAAVDTIAACFPSRATVAVEARALLTGGGSFHCMTQQQPLAES